MSNQQITSLPPAIAATGTDQIETVQAGTSKRLTLAQVATYVGASGSSGVTSIATASPIAGGPITATGTISLQAAGVANSYLSTMANGTIKANTSGSSASPQDVTMSAILDTISSTRGTILYRGASGWAALSPGASGYYLTAAGAGADPAWAFSGISISATAPPSPVLNQVWIDIS